MELSDHLHIAAVLSLQTIPGTASIGGWTRKPVSTFKYKEHFRQGPRCETISALSCNHCCRGNATISSRCITKLHMALSMYKMYKLSEIFLRFLADVTFLNRL